MEDKEIEKRLADKIVELWQGEEFLQGVKLTDEQKAELAVHYLNGKI